MKSNKLLTTLIVLSVITLGLMTEGNDYVTFEVSGNDLNVVLHQELNGSIVDKQLNDTYWLYTNGNITTTQYGNYFEVSKNDYN